MHAPPLGEACVHRGSFGRNLLAYQPICRRVPINHVSSLLPFSQPGLAALSHRLRTCSCSLSLVLLHDVNLYDAFRPLPLWLLGRVLLAVARVFPVFVRLLKEVYESTFSFVLGFWHPGKTVSATSPQHTTSFKQKVIWQPRKFGTASLDASSL